MTEIKQHLQGLNEAAKLIQEANAAKGFWSEGKNRNVGELLMLVTSELGEAMEAHRKGKFADLTQYKVQFEDQGKLEENYPELSNIIFADDVKDSFEDEICDAVIRLLDMAGGLGIDLERHITLKLAYNARRPKLHGKKY